ncbi:MAG: shikimate kinase [Eubacteriales bacterium]
MKNVVLIGMPGCGKSTIGVVLAKTMGYRFLDTDIVIQEMQHRKLQEIMDADGVEFLLQAEEEAILSTQCSETVIATGGSAVFSQKSMNHLKENGVAVYLQLPYETVEQRLSNLATRGVAGSGTMTLREIYDMRTPLYSRYADVVIDCRNKGIEEIAQEVSDIMQKL